MKVLYTRTLKSGKRHVLIELQNDDEKLMGVAKRPLHNADPCRTHCRGTDTSAAH